MGLFGDIYKGITGEKSEEDEALDRRIEAASERRVAERDYHSNPNSYNRKKLNEAENYCNYLNNKEKEGK